MIGNTWDSILKEEKKKKYFRELMNVLKEEYKIKSIFPREKDIFNAFKYTTYENVKVVILGQDPYHGEGQAHGLSFSVGKSIKKPPSLLNIFKELKSDLGYEIPDTGSLVSWANEGVLLLNTVLTVEKNKPSSHSKLGWQKFTDKVIEKLNEKEQPVVFIFWGNFAKSKSKIITNKHHFVIESPHPSPFSAYSGFFGSKPFSKTNKFLISKTIEPVNWDIK